MREHRWHPRLKEPMTTPEQKKLNQRLGQILGAIAVLIFLGFMLKGATVGF